jgi:hypothetical protein
VYENASFSHRPLSVQPTTCPLLLTAAASLLTPWGPASAVIEYPVTALAAGATAPNAAKTPPTANTLNTTRKSSSV